ncbi:hypothetical protein H8E07_04375 [bacterium]|nr:hypothetical protein [bacterium]
MDLTLSAADYNLLLEHVELSPRLERSLRAGLVEGMFLRFSLTDEEAMELTAVVVFAAAAGERKRRRALKRLADRLGRKLDLADMSPEVVDEAFGRAGDAYNNTRRADLGGFSPMELQTLFSNDWSPDTPGLRLRGDPPAGLLVESDVLHNARVMLRALADGGTRATPAGNLNRAFVADMLASLRFREGHLEELRRFNKVINEQDAWLVHDLRVVLELARLIRLERGRFRLTKRGRDLLRDDRAGELLALLVETAFRVFNLGYHDRLPELPEFQNVIAYPLAVLSRQPEGWRVYGALASELLHPAIAEVLPRHDHLDFGEALIRIRVVERLEALGLVEVRRETHEVTHHLGRLTHVRRTPLFSAVLEFDL